LDRTPFAGFFLNDVVAAAGQFRIPPRELEEMLPQQLLMLVVAARAARAAGLRDEERLRTAVFVGIGLDLNTTNYHFRWSVRGPRDAAGPPLTANRTMGGLGSIIASRVARELRLGGPSHTVSGEECSGLIAVQIAGRALRGGAIDQAVVGAVDLAGDVRAALTTHRHRPYSASGRVLPFDRGSDGPVIGEGAAAVMLKRLDDALRDGDRIHAVIRGVGTASGGGPLPSPEVYTAALERAYSDSGVAPSSVAYLEAHGSGDPGEDSAEAEALAGFFAGKDKGSLTIGSAKADIGHAGAAGGLASFVKACLCLEHQIIPGLRGSEDPLADLDHLRVPRSPAYWVRDRDDGPRRAGVSSQGVDGNCVHVILEEHEPSPVTDAEPTTGPRDEALFSVEGGDVAALVEGLGRLRDRVAEMAELRLEEAARDWSRRQPARPQAPLAVAMVARGRAELLEQIDTTQRFLRERPHRSLPAPGTPAALRDRVFYSPRPLGGAGTVAFVFPGSGNDFPGMGRDLALWRPGVLRRQDAENRRLRSQLVADGFWTDDRVTLSVRDRIFGQVSLGALVADLLAESGVRPAAAVGYSLGESAALFALRAWTDRDEMLRSMHDSPLFATDLTGPCDAARRAWKLPDSAPVEWAAGIVDRGPEEVRAALTGLERAYLLIVNTPRECVVGGERAAVEQLTDRLGARFLALPNTTTVHCPIAREVADAYRELHRLPTTPPPGVRFYSAALGHAYEVNPDSAAEAILAQALDTVDFPAVVESAYRDGARIFVEPGPGGSCSRMITTILGDRPHRARSACVAGADNVSTVLRLLAQLVAERVPIDWNALYPAPIGDEADRVLQGRKIVLRPGGDPFVIPKPPPIPPHTRNSEPAPHPSPAAVSPASPFSDPAGVVPVLASLTAAEEARSRAHAAYLRLAESAQRGVAGSVAFQTAILESLLAAGNPIALADAPPDPAPTFPLVIDRNQCLEFAIGSIAKVLGPAFAEVDTFPTRVRLPDEPLMLVDRITALEGEPLSLGAGRVVTEHDVRPGSWYLDGGRIPTSVAVEAGQADLFLSGYLGIDSRTRGLAVYRLLDAVVTFHRGLPPPGEVIRYDIRIERFFRQGETYLFRFRFEGTVGGQPLLTMTDGCAGFFTAEALAAGKGIVHTALDRRPGQGVVPDDAAELPPVGVESYSEEQVEALRRGDAAACFGPAFAGISLPAGQRLPAGRMRLVDRVTSLEPQGGRFGVGLIRAEMDVEPEAWFLTCHFVDDRVMPGTLMYECCLHTLRIFLLRRGWVAPGAEVVSEPVPGVASRLKCRGQVTATTRTVTYEVTLKELGYGPEPFAIADALMYADGKPIVEITNMSLRLTGLDREAVRATWRDRLAGGKPRALFGPERILAFAVGKPSEAFGEPYRVFDNERIIARLPGPPYQFLDRITRINAEPWKMVAGGEIEAEYDVPPEAWYFAADRQPAMPFAVLLEVALQPCGWLAAYIGSALTSPVDLSFRNLGGSAELLEEVGPDSGTLTTRVRITRVSRSAGMIIQGFDFAVGCGGRPVYRGETTFGFFPKEALARQVGLRDEVVYEPGEDETLRAETIGYPDEAPLPDERWRMIDRVDALIPDGGPHGLGFVRGTKTVNPDEWFFKAHFYQDPVVPGSLGLESLLQLLKVLALRRFGGRRFAVMRGGPHSWVYRGQVVPTCERVTVTAVVTASDDANRRLTADGFLSVDGRTIYKMKDFTLGVVGDRP
jgi:acyl transferase domain-containing protein/3-hydroxymyristoyl/3-hydroxydecanoyl-(acyl carrier protein) dehydratase